MLFIATWHDRNLFFKTVKVSVSVTEWEDNVLYSSMRTRLGFLGRRAGVTPEKGREKFPRSSATVLPKKGGEKCLGSHPRSRSSRRGSASCMISEPQWKGWQDKNRPGERIKRMWQLWGSGVVNGWRAWRQREGFGGRRDANRDTTPADYE